MIVGDLVDAGQAEIRTGPFGTQLKASQYAESGRPVLNVRNVGFGDVRPEKLEFVDELTAERLSGHILEEGDIVFGRKGAVERHAFIRADYAGALQGSDCIRLRLSPDAPIRPGFATFALRTPAHQAWMQRYCSHGATMASLNQDILRQIKLPDLDLRSQDGVIAVLQTIDDLIENNGRRVEVLEEMARAIYQEWFVHLRFPGHENATFFDSDLGPIPDGWSIQLLGDLATVDKGLSYKGAFLTDDGVPMANLKCIGPGGGFRRDGTKPYSGTFKPRHEVQPGDIVIANTDLTQAGNVIGAPAKVPRKGFEGGGIISHHISAIRPRDVAAKPWMYRSLEDRRFRDYARSVASGATVLGFRPDDTKAYPVVTPPASILDGFAEIERPMVVLRERLLEAAEGLSELRNLLLPKLVTGQIDVSDLDLDASVEKAGV